ncbi:hypothetical protein E3E14_30135 [Streptomyces sp. ICN441]|uniref:hypothetical protein n=1 Tax=Streptomyces TaxID=1883 RepID=UPI00106DB089|nr:MULTISPECIES: hypothetical protein [Streptomyces]TFE37078.1 hypothetical protein E3E14_30135 [Streptomyces sp. ICN441]
MSRPAPVGALEDTTALIGRAFAVALHEGLSAVAPTWATRGAGTREPRPAPPEPHIVLLRVHREEILGDLAGELPTALAATGHPDVDRACRTLLDWALTLFPQPQPAPPGLNRPAGGPALPASRMRLTVATLLLECAARRLPDVPARALALQSLGRAARGAGPGAGTTGRPDGT